MEFCVNGQVIDSLEGLIAFIAQNGLPYIQYDNPPSNDAAQTDTGTVLSVGDNETAFIQNLSTNPLKVKLGAGASATSFHFILKAGAAQDDGTGGLTRILNHKGDVSVFGISPRYISWKR